MEPAVLSMPISSWPIRLPDASSPPLIIPHFACIVRRLFAVHSRTDSAAATAAAAAVVAARPTSAPGTPTGSPPRFPLSIPLLASSCSGRFPPPPSVFFFPPSWSRACILLLLLSTHSLALKLAVGCTRRCSAPAPSLHHLEPLHFPKRPPPLHPPPPDHDLSQLSPHCSSDTLVRALDGSFDDRYESGGNGAR